MCDLDGHTYMSSIISDNIGLLVVCSVAEGLPCISSAINENKILTLKHTRPPVKG